MSRNQIILHIEPQYIKLYGSDKIGDIANEIDPVKSAAQFSIQILI